MPKIPFDVFVDPEGNKILVHGTFTERERRRSIPRGYSSKGRAHLYARGAEPLDVTVLRKASPSDTKPEPDS